MTGQITLGLVGQGMVLSHFAACFLPIGIGLQSFILRWLAVLESGAGTIISLGGRHFTEEVALHVCCTSVVVSDDGTHLGQILSSRRNGILVSFVLTLTSLIGWLDAVRARQSCDESLGRVIISTMAVSIAFCVEDLARII